MRTTDEHYLTDYRAEGGIRVVVYVPTSVPQIQPDAVMDPIYRGMVRLADTVDECLPPGATGEAAEG